jgi:hypothetical protein
VADRPGRLYTSFANLLNPVSRRPFLNNIEYPQESFCSSPVSFASSSKSGPGSRPRVPAVKLDPTLIRITPYASNAILFGISETSTSQPWLTHNPYDVVICNYNELEHDPLVSACESVAKEQKPIKDRNRAVCKIRPENPFPPPSLFGHGRRY